MLCEDEEKNVHKIKTAFVVFKLLNKLKKAVPISTKSTLNVNTQ